jgi:hypothetical protein
MSSFDFTFAELQFVPRARLSPEEFAQTVADGVAYCRLVSQNGRGFGGSQYVQSAVVAAYLRQPLAERIIANPEVAFAIAEEIDRHLAESS